MKKSQLFRAFAAFFTFVLVVLPAFAQDLDNNPRLADLTLVFVRVLNWGFVLVGVVLVGVIVYGAWKASMALGNPRGLEAARGTWTSALLGFLIVIAFYAIFSIVAGFFGLDFSITGILGNFSNAVEELTGITTMDP